MLHKKYPTITTDLYIFILIAATLSGSNSTIYMISKSIIHIDHTNL